MLQSVIPFVSAATFAENIDEIKRASSYLSPSLFLSLSLFLSNDRRKREPATSMAIDRREKRDPSARLKLA